MKLLKAKVKITHNGGGTQYTYPQIWLDNKERIPAILYPKDRTDELVEGNMLYQVVFPVVPDDLYDELLRLPEFSIPSQTEVRAYTDKHAPKREVMQDEEKVLSLLAKVGRGATLNQQEKNALDPAHPEKGLGMSKDFVEVCNDYGVIFQK